MDNPNDFFGWLAVQPPFVEVALGAFFCLIVAPALLAGVATAVTALEALAETRLIPLLAFGAFGHGGRFTPGLQDLNCNTRNISNADNHARRLKN